MNRRELLSGAALLAGATQANAFGVGRLGLGEGRGGALGGAQVPAPPILDRTNVFAAYSLRRVTSYTGPLVRIRRASDSVEQDFSAVSATGFVNTAAIDAFIGTSTGFISKWYDQGSGGLDLVQATAGSQPAYSPYMYGARPGVSFNGTSSALTLASVVWSAADFQMYAVASGVFEAAPAYRSFFGIAPAATTGIEVLWNNQTLQDWVAGDARANGNGFNSGRAPRAIPTAPGLSDSYNRQHDITLAAAGSDWFLDGSALTLRVSGAGQVPAVTGTMQLGGTNAFKGTMTEVIVFNTVYSGRTALRANQKAAYTTPLYSVWAEMWGDSLTFGGQDGTTTNPPSVLQGSFTPLKVVQNGGVSGETSSQILTRFNAQTPSPKGYATIIWAGRNNVASSAQVQSDIAAMVAALTTPRYLVLSIINQEIEPSGDAVYNQIAALNSALSATYGSRYLDVRATLVAAFSAGNAVDVLDHAADIPPFTLRAKTTHTLSGNVLAGDTSFSISGFTVGQVSPGGILLIGSEYVYVISGSGTSITNCTRGYAGTVAAGYSSGQSFTYCDGLHLGANGYTTVGNAIYTKILALGGW